MPNFDKDALKNAREKKEKSSRKHLTKLHDVSSSTPQIPTNDLSISQRLRHSTTSTPIQGTSRNHPTLSLQHNNQLSHQQQIMRDEALDAFNKGSGSDSVYHEQLSNDPTFVTSPDDETSESTDDFDLDMSPDDNLKYLKHIKTHHKSLHLSDDLTFTPTETDHECTHCGAQLFPGESEQVCCSAGAVKIDPFQKPDSEPQLSEWLELQELYKEENFIKHSRLLNRLCSMASLGSRVVPYTGTTSVIMGGQVVANVDGIERKYGSKFAKFAEVYCLDPDRAEQARIQCLLETSEFKKSSDKVQRDIERYLKSLSSYIQKYNRFAQAFQMLKTDLDEMTQEERSQIFSIGMKNSYSLQPVTSTDDTARLPTNPEFAFVYPGTADREIEFICKYKSGHGLTTINILNQAFLPMRFPLIYLHGEFGWNAHMPLAVKNKKSVRVSMRQYFRFISQERQGVWNPIHHCGSLAQEFYATAGMMLEQNQLNYFQHNQQHSNKYFRSTFHESSPGNPETQQKDITISSKFFGTKAFYEGLYMKMNTLFSQKNKPMVFFTFTANPNMFGNDYDNRFRKDKLSRVFSLQVDHAIHNFGLLTGHKVCAYGWVTEYQKRGNPHIHSVLALDEPVDENGNLSPDVIDDIIQAYYPDESSAFSEDVKSFMVHRCRAGGCLRNGKCMKRFPFQPADETHFKEGHIHYKLYGKRAGYDPFENFQ
ncbi:unnamed protein product [Ambrosiozyma monospora]|uniref:Unnamed protein product n=1 Tax=Ambrosiozyma monospora TaxID=43982 RepID=A0A9W7DE00_AMBMO|nr:unnamed protein product [Ambrosiozyma monospora]